MGSGGSPQRRRCTDRLTIHEDLASEDLREQVRRVEAPEPGLGDAQHAPDDGGGAGDLLVALRRPGAQRTVANGLSTRLPVRR